MQHKTLLRKTSLLLIVLTGLALNYISASTKRKENIKTPPNSLRGNGMEFIENKGQVVDMAGKTRPDILFTGDGKGGKVYLRKGAISFVFSNIHELTKEVEEQVEELEESEKITQEQVASYKDSLLLQALLKVSRVDVEFEGSNKQTEIIKDDEVEGLLNYYYPHCTQGVKVHAYNKITYKEMYKRVDVIFYGGKELGMKYDIIVKPNADPSQIKLRYNGANSVTLKNNRLSVITNVGLLGEYIPKIYQVIGNKEIEVGGTYVLNRDNDGDEVSFKLAAFDTNYPLIIDPWVSYYGGSGGDSFVEGSVNTDYAGNVIFSGRTSSIDFPVSPGAYQTIFIPSYALYLVKFTSSGNRVFGTYYGGNMGIPVIAIGGGGNRGAAGVAADASGNIFLTGSTSSTDLPTMDPGGGAYFQGTVSGNYDAFISKFDPDGALLWSTFYGGNKPDEGIDVTVDKADNVILAGSTNSTNFITQLPYQANNAGNSDGFIAKFNNVGVLLWSTYFGGSTKEYAEGVSTDNNNNIFITGNTASTNFPITSGAFQTVCKNSGSNFLAQGPDVFVSKFLPDGTLDWSTFYGGSRDDYATAIATDQANNVVITGGTNSSDLPVSPGAFQSALSNVQTDDTFIAKFDNQGNWKWGSYYGGTSGEEASGIATDNNNNIVITGDTYSHNLPVTSCAYQTHFAGTEDQYIATFDSLGNILCSGYIGIGNSNSPNNETHTNGGALATSANFAYLIATSSCNYPVTPNAFQYVCGGGSDRTIAQICILSCGIKTATINFNSVTHACVSMPIDFTTNNTLCSVLGTYKWYFDGGTPATSTLQNPTGIIFNDQGIYNVKVVVTTPCGIDSLTKTAYLTIYPSLTIADFTSNTSICQGDTITLKATATGGNGTYHYSWQPGNLTGASVIVKPQSTTIYTITVSNNFGCTGTNTGYDEVFVYPVPTASFIYDPNDPEFLDAIQFTDESISDIVSWDWSFGDINNSISTLKDPSFAYPDTGMYNVKLIVTDLNKCMDTVIKPIHIRADYKFYAPNSFTPNGDHVNDVFGVYAGIISRFEMFIFDRWGNKIYQTTNINSPWDGRINGQDAQEDVYIYLVNTTDFKNQTHNYTGHVSLVR